MDEDVLALHIADAKVLGRAREVMDAPPTEDGYVDVGDVLVDYLRGRMSMDAAITRMNELESDYDKKRGGSARPSIDG